MLRKTMLAMSIGIFATVAFYVVDIALNELRLRTVPKNFSVVEAGVLYRSGQLRSEHFRRVVEQHGIRMVVCLNPDMQSDEPRLAAEVGVKFVSLSMPGSGQGEAALFHRYLDLLAEPDNQPMLVHCAAGAYRTGAAVALYRMLFHGWTLDDAVEEMKYSGFAGQTDLVEHVKMVYATIPAGLFRRVTASWPNSGDSLAKANGNGDAPSDDD